MKVTVTMVTKSRNNLVARITKKSLKDFKILEIQELKESNENQNAKKTTSTWINGWPSWDENKNFETNLLANRAKQLDENKHMVLLHG